MLCGFARVDITPDPARQEVYGLGYWFRRSIRFVGVRDPLYVRCAAMGQGPQRCFIISVDATLDSFGFSARAAGRIARQYGVSPGQVFIHCTHTHSAPLSGLNGREDDSGYGAAVEDRIIESAAQAVKNQIETTLSLSETSVPGLLYNRRPLLADGTIAELHGSLDTANVADPGLVNETMTFIRFHRPDGLLLGGICHFGIHGVCIQCSDLISSDCMGQAIQRAERDIKGQPCILFLNGPCGDIDPAAMGDEASLEKTASGLHGQIMKLAAAAGTPLRLEPTHAQSGSFRARRRLAKPADEIARLQAELEPAARKEKGPKHHSGPGYELFLLEEERQLSLLPEYIDIPYTVLGLGDIIFLGVAGEVFTEFGLKLGEVLSYPRVFTVGLVGGWNGYLPPASAYDRGGYEVTPSRWSRIAPGETERLFDHLCKEFTTWQKS